MSRQKKNTAAWRLFHIKYEVSVPQLFMYGKPYLEKHGYHVSGDNTLDNERLMEPTRVRQTVAGMALLHDEGAPVEIINHRDSVDIYDDIQEHLRNWERLANQGIHPDDLPPIEDLRMFESVAMELHQTAKHYEPNEVTGNVLRDRLMSMNRRRNPVRTERYLRQKIQDEKGELKPYVSIVDNIEKRLFGSVSWQ